VSVGGSSAAAVASLSGPVVLLVIGGWWGGGLGCRRVEHWVYDPGRDLAVAGPGTAPGGDVGDDLRAQP